MLEHAKKTKGTADTIDKYVGKQLRNRRTLLGLSQEKLADSVGVTFQQVQKYERGSNRISASRLYSFSKILDVSIDYFYDGISDKDIESSGAATAVNSDDADGTTNLPENLMSQKETLNLLKAYYSVKEDGKRKDILRLVKSMAKNLS